MAWLITQNSESMRYLPQFIPTPECPSWDVKAAYRDEHGFIPNGINSAGNFVEDRFWPESGRFRDEIDIVPRLMGMCGFFMIPESWYEIIEDYEPGIHQFKHIPLTLRDGSPLEERFYAMNIRQSLIDVADRDRSTAPLDTNMSRLSRPYLFMNTADRPNTKVYFFQERVAKFHLWVPMEILIYHIAMSNELFDRISQLGGMDTIDALQIEEV
jgi:hypothetical protein